MSERQYCSQILCHKLWFDVFAKSGKLNLPLLLPDSTFLKSSKNEGYPYTTTFVMWLKLVDYIVTLAIESKKCSRINCSTTGTQTILEQKASGISKKP